MEDLLIEKCNKIIDKEINELYRDEAKEIIKLTTDKNREEFVEYYLSDIMNISCLVLDKAKSDLINEGILKYNKNDNFGKVFK
jgi:hypothetical protein